MNTSLFWHTYLTNYPRFVYMAIILVIVCFILNKMFRYGKAYLIAFAFVYIISDPLHYYIINYFHNSDEKKPILSEFTPYLAESNQPCCVVGAFTMYAKEALNVELTPQFIEINVMLLNRPVVEILAIVPTWDYLFPSNQLVIMDTNTPVYLDRPYLWTGKWSDDNDTYHTCLVYFHSNSVTYKHFIYDPDTKTNYMVTTNYEHFLNRTVCLYEIQKKGLDK